MDVVINKQKITNIANAIREKDRSESTYSLDEIADKAGEKGFFGIKVSIEPKHIATEVSSGTSLTASINCEIGDVVVACFMTRNCPTPTLSAEWTLISTSNVTTTDQYGTRLNWAKKVAESTTESITVTQPSAGRIYINLVALPSTAVITDNGYTNYETAASSFTASKPSGLVIWGAVASLWATSGTPYPVWTTSNEQYLIQLGTLTQSRLVTGRDGTDVGSVTFNTNATASAATTAIIGSLSVTGVDEFAEVKTGKLKYYKTGVLSEFADAMSFNGLLNANISWKNISGVQKNILWSPTIYRKMPLQPINTNFQKLYLSSDTLEDYAHTDYQVNQVSNASVSNIATPSCYENENNFVAKYVVTLTNSDSSNAININSLKKTSALNAASSTTDVNECLMWGYFFDTPITIPASGSKNIIFEMRY